MENEQVPAITGADVSENHTIGFEGGFSRRDFFKGAAVLAAGVSASSLLTACSTEGGASASNKPVSFKSGSYTASAEGKHGPVSVQVTVDESQITDIEILKHKETADLSDIALKVIPQAILHTQSLGVDTVSGATLVSMAVVSAVSDCCEQAGGDTQILRKRPAAVNDIVQQMKPGVYTGEAYGKWKKGTIEGERFGCPATIAPTAVEIEVDETSILSVKVKGTSDTPGFNEPAVGRTPQDIVSQQSIYVDTVAGATLTAAAITSATAKALETAGADLVGFAKATEHDSSEAEEYTCDLVIVGAGTAGTSAALKAAELGIDTVVIEKTARISGTGACATGPLGVASSLHTKAGRTMTASEMFTSMMEENDYRANAPLVKTWLNGAGRMIDWIQGYWTKVGDKGFQLPAFKDPYNYSCPFGKGTSKFQDLWDNFITPKGVQLLQSSEVNKITIEDDKVTGVIAIDKLTGGTITIHSKTVIMATGGFGGNPAEMKKRLGSDNFYLYGLSSNIGTGIDLCEGLGCVICEELEPALAEFCGNNEVDFYAGYMKFINQCGFLMVDPAGNRFVNEELFLTQALEAGASALRRVGFAYVLFTQADFDSMSKQGVHGHLTKGYTDSIEMRARILVDSFYTLPDEMAEALDKGEAFKADTVDELIEKVGFDKGTFKDTVKAYSQVATDKVDPEFGKNPDLIFPFEKGPFYAVRVISPIDNTYNGVKVDTKFRPLCGDKQTPSLGGLYVVGQDSGNVFSYPYTKYVGSCSSYALTSGMLSAESVAAYLGR